MCFETWRHYEILAPENPAWARRALRRLRRCESCFVLSALHLEEAQRVLQRENDFVTSALHLEAPLCCQPPSHATSAAVSSCSSRGIPAEEKRTAPAEEYQGGKTQTIPVNYGYTRDACCRLPRLYRWCRRGPLHRHVSGCLAAALQQPETFILTQSNRVTALDPWLLTTTYR